MSNKQEPPRFCSNCGLSLVKLDTWCSSRNCHDCGKEIFFVRRGEDGGVRVEQGESFHIPQITLSLDPNAGGQFFKYGLEAFLKQMFLGQKIDSDDNLVSSYKEIESTIDGELATLDCISHCDLETEEGAFQATEILEAEGLHEYKYNLFRSCFLRQCYSSLEEGNAVHAVYAAHQAALFKEYSLLENHHLKEIIWLGYRCYVDICKNENMTDKAAKEKILVKNTQSKIKNLDNEYLYALVNDGNNIGVRLSLSGIEENTLKALLEHELNQRKEDRENLLKMEEINVNKRANNIKIWLGISTLANIILLASHRGWI